jgi:hypothetical protein
VCVCSDVLPPSKDRVLVMGLLLLHWLVEGQTGELYCVSELLSDAEKASPEISLVLGMRAHMDEGAYNRVLAATASPPCALFAPMLKQVAGTVRDEIAKGAEASYASLPVADAAKMMNLLDEEALREYAGEAHPQWTFTSGSSSTRVVFGSRAGDSGEVRAAPVISRTLQYAGDIERIV